MGGSGWVTMLGGADWKVFPSQQHTWSSWKSPIPGKPGQGGGVICVDTSILARILTRDNLCIWILRSVASGTGGPMFYQLSNVSLLFFSSLTLTEQSSLCPTTWPSPTWAQSFSLVYQMNQGFTTTTTTTHKIILFVLSTPLFYSPCLSPLPSLSMH